jgi:hypothetical protein
MKRISREELRMLIQIGLTVRKKYERRHLELQMTSAVEAVTDAIVMAVMRLTNPGHAGCALL